LFDTEVAFDSIELISVAFNDELLDFELTETFSFLLTERPALMVWVLASF